MVDLSKQQAAAAETTRDWRKSMSDHVAYALLVYTALTIFVTIKALEAGSSPLLPYIGLVVLVAAIIPACRKFEKSWADLDDETAAQPSPPEGFRRDTILVWTLAIGLPIVLTGIIKAAFAALG